MWKVCQLLKSGRSQISRSRNATNPLSSQSSASSPNIYDENSEIFKWPITRRPEAFTPSNFRLNSTQNRRSIYTFVPFRSNFSSPEDNRINEEFTDDEENYDRNHRGKHGFRSGRRGDRRFCRCRCAFGDFLGYTTMVAATIHLSRMTVHLLPTNKDQIKLRTDEANSQPAATPTTKFSVSTKPTILSNLKEHFKESYQKRKEKFLYKTAHLLFPDLFKRLYVLPPRCQCPPSCDCQFTSSNLNFIATSPSIESENVADKNAFLAPLLERATPSTSSPESLSISSSSDAATILKPKFGECAVQTDAIEIGTPFDEPMWDAGRRLAAATRLTDVSLEHAIGVDFLKRKLYDEAVDYLIGAARSGHTGSLYNLGICYSRGFGVRKDFTKAIEFWRMAADQGHGLSKYQLGACYARGLGGLTANYDRAIRYMEGAASAGIAEAKTYLAAHEYKQGRLDGALTLLRDAVAGGDELANELLNYWTVDDVTCDENSKSEIGYTFDDLTNEKSTREIKMASNAITTSTTATNPGRRRFWATSSSERDDSLSFSSSASSKSAKNPESITSSVVFCHESPSESEKSSDSGMQIMKTVVEKGIYVMEKAASLLTVPTGLRRSKTAPEFRVGGYENFEYAIATGNVVEIRTLNVE